MARCTFRFTIVISETSAKNEKRKADDEDDDDGENIDLENEVFVSSFLF